MSMLTERRFYLTTPIYYVNDKPHVGHAYTSLAADVLARWKRMSGEQVHFLTGTDEHGQKVEKAAEARGMEPQAFTDQVSEAFRDLAARMNFSNDDFIRTTEERHKQACAALWQRLEERGQIYLGHYEGWYAVRDEAFYGPDEITEKDGQKFAPTGAPVEWVREPSYFFHLSAWQDWLLQYYEDHPDFIGPQSRRNEVVSFVKGGLTDLSISRTSFKWGVKVPGDEAHVMYVWLDALTNYITALGYPDENTELWKFWPADVHMVGKDILRFHAIYWPAFLQAAGFAAAAAHLRAWLVDQRGAEDLQVARQCHRPAATDRAVRARSGALLPVAGGALGNDGDFSRKALMQRLNSELANDLGNLAQRTLSLIQRNCEGRLPAAGDISTDDAVLMAPLDTLAATVGAHLDRQEFHLALEEVWRNIRAANLYITQQQPWALKKTDLDRMNVVLRHLHTAMRAYATVLLPFMPQTMDSLLDQLAVPAGDRHLAALARPLAEGTTLPPPSPLFQKIQDDVA